MVDWKDFSGDGKPPKLSEDIRILLAEKYIELFEKLTGQKFIPSVGNVNKRILENLSNAELLW